MKSFFRILAIAGCAALGLAGPAASSARADMAYGVTLIGNQLIGVDTTTGAGTLIGPLSGGNVNPFGLVGFNNQLYTFNSATDAINQISTTTGATVASFSLNVGPVLGAGGLAFQTATTGFLTTALDPTTYNYANNLYRFDTATGTTTLITQTADTLSALAYSGTGTLYALGQLDGNLYTINTTTGAMTTVGNVGVALGSPINSLAFGTNGALYATLDDALYSLNTATGAATAIGDPAMGTGFASVSGLAFANGSLPNFGAVPEPASVVMLGVGLLGTAGVVRFRRARSRRAA